PGAVGEVRGGGAIDGHALDREHHVLDVDLIGVPRLDAHDDAARHRAGDVLPGRPGGIADAEAERVEGGAAQIEVAIRVGGAGRVGVFRAPVDDRDDHRLAAVADLRAGAAAVDGVEVAAVRAGDGREIA